MQDDIVLIPTLGSHRTDEVLSYSFTPTSNTLPQSATGEALQPLSKARIERNLDGVELNHSRDRDDDIYSLFEGEGLPGDMICWYLIEGEDNDTLRLFCAVDLPVPQEKWGHALLFSNAYHSQCRVGKTYLRIKEGDPEAQLYFEARIDVPDGVTDSALQRFMMLSLYAAHVFFEKSLTENLFVPARSKKRRRPHTTREVRDQN
jgi:putative sensory transduction regulator